MRFFKSFPFSYILYGLASLLFFQACTVVKNYPQATPFVYATTVEVAGKFSKDERKELVLQLLDQLHDSIKVRSVSKFIGFDRGPKLFYQLMDKPTAFDSLYAGQSMGFMRSLLQSRGYYRDSMYFTTKINPRTDSTELRTEVTFHVNPGIVTRIDSIAYLMNADTLRLSARQKSAQDTLQKLTLESKPQALIKKSGPFSKPALAAERDRLANVYRNNGYLRFSEEELLVLWDTVGIALLRPTFDPTEEARLLQELAARRAAPVADLEFRLRENPDSTRITRYYVGNVSIYPDFTTDTTKQFRYVDSADRYVVKYNRPLFKTKIFPDYVFLNPGELYRQNNFINTQNKFNALSAWRLVNIEPRLRPGTDTADFDIRLVPARKYSFTINQEISYNRGTVTIAQGNFLGIGINSTLQNRNFSRSASQGITTLRFGLELNATFKDFIQTRQLALGHSIQIPRLVPRFLRKYNRAKENTVASILNVNGGITHRTNYFTLTSINGSWGYQFNWRNKLLNIRYPNVEYNYLIQRDSLVKLIASNPSYKYIFNTGLIVSGAASFAIAGGHGNTSNVTTLSAELSGVPGLLRNAFATNLYRFVKLDAEYRQTQKKFRNAFAWRLFGGFGWSLPTSSKDSNNFYLPFFRQYYVGGPNSMRAWSIRRLGPGSTIKSFGRTGDAAPDRFGDVRVEANAEYRIFLFDYGTITVGTVLFTDMGNVWFLRKNRDFPDGEFPRSFSKLWKDIAIGAGTGLRVDFSTFLKLRLDYAYKVKNPTPDILSAQNKWFYGWGLLNGQLQIGVDYPF